jgi:hypothetical protein
MVYGTERWKPCRIVAETGIEEVKIGRKKTMAPHEKQNRRVVAETEAKPKGKKNKTKPRGQRKKHDAS